MDKELLRLILKYSFYEANKSNISKDMFSLTLQGIYELIIETHGKYKRDLSITEVKELYKVNNPTITKTAWDNLCIILDNLPAEINEDVAKEIIKKAKFIDAARRLADAGIQIVNGKTIEITQIRKIVEEIETGGTIESITLEPITDDIDTILAEVNLTTKWHYNIPSLHTVAGGIGPGILKGAFGRVETGKSAYWISLCAGPKGFAVQGARIIAFCNEERAIRSKARAVMAYTGMNLLELQTNVKQASKLYSKIKDNLIFYDAKGLDISELKSIIHQQKPDIVVSDQLDKVYIRGSFMREDERLGALYIRTRDICIEEDCGWIALSQANAEAEGKAYMASSNMAAARTSKAAEVDVLIGIGKSPQHTDNTRVLNIIKNKVTGRHEEVVCRIIPEISQYVE